MAHELEICELEKFHGGFDVALGVEDESAVPVHDDEVVLRVLELKRERVVHLERVEGELLGLQKRRDAFLVRKKLLGVAGVTGSDVDRVLLAELLHVLPAFLLERLAAERDRLFFELEDVLRKDVGQVEARFGDQNIRRIGLQRKLALLLAKRDRFLAHDELLGHRRLEVVRGAFYRRRLHRLLALLGACGLRNDE